MIICWFENSHVFSSPWELSSLASKISALSKALPLEALTSLENTKERNSLEAERIVALFANVNYINSQEQQQEFESILHLIANDLKIAHPNLNFEYFNEDFDELGSIYGTSGLVSTGGN